MISQQGNLLQNSIETIENQILDLEKTFVWKDFSKDQFDEFQKQKSDNQNKEFQIKTKENELEESRKNLDLIRKKLEQAKDRFLEISNENLEFKTKITSNTALLKELNPSDYSVKTESEVQLQLKNLKQDNLNTETVWNHLISEIQEKVLAKA